MNILDRLTRRWKTWTLGLRLVLGYAVLFIASVALLAALAYVLLIEFMREPDWSFMEEQAHELTRVYERGGAEALQTYLEARPSDERLQELIVRLSDEEGRTLLLYNPDNWARSEIELLENRPVPAEETSVQLGAAEDEDPLGAFIIPQQEGAMLQVGMDADLPGDVLESMQAVFLAIALPVVLLALLGGVFMAYRALRPLRRLVGTFETVIDTGDVQTRVAAEDLRGEFARLAVLFNQMLGRIERLVNSLRSTLDNVAHDLRTPMTRLRGRAELMLQNERDKEEMQEALADVVEASDVVLQMLDTIMDVSEAEAGAMHLQQETIAAARLVEDVVEVYQIVAAEKEITLETSAAEDVGLSVDISRMRQALANLIDNAIKYTPAGGHVEVEVMEKAGSVRIQVRDDGMGIPPEELPRIWDRLYRGDKSRSERGLGLGLSLVRAIVEAHGGRVDAQSTPGEGSVFTISVPSPDNR